jgi:ribonuclease P protein component
MERRADPPGPPGGPDDPARPARFGRAHRLSRTWQYQRTYAEGRSVRGRLVVLYAHVVPGEPSRLGIVASRKVGGAVIRNRTKRRLREVGRALWPRVRPDGRQLVLIALPAAAAADSAELAADVADLLRRMEALTA